MTSSNNNNHKTMKMRINDRKMIEPDCEYGDRLANPSTKAPDGRWLGLDISLGILFCLICLMGAGIVGRVLFEIARMGWNVWGDFFPR